MKYENNKISLYYSELQHYFSLETRKKLRTESDQLYYRFDCVEYILDLKCLNKITVHLWNDMTGDSHFMDIQIDEKDYDGLRQLHKEAFFLSLQ